MTVAAAARPGEVLPPLRDDLELVAAQGGEAGVMLVDHARNQHFRLTRRAVDLLSGWHLGTAQALAGHLATSGHAPPSPDELADMTKMLTAGELTSSPPSGGWKAYAAASERRRKGAASAALHSYLFFRVPLVRPQPFLEIVWPHVSFLFTRAAAIIFMLLALVGLFLVSRQTEVFVATFQRLFSLHGLTIYAVALIVTKALHELGHAFMAHKHGIKVPVIGAALILLMPILYTDVTGSWRCNRRKRLMIGAAGMMTELALAVLATLWWVFAPDGTGRDIAFATATLGWVMSLAVNLNPLMRFDGYYLLADVLGVDNLQTRGFALARWRLREALFGFGEAPPEIMAPAMRRVLIVHALATMVYRFFLFLAIALVVYHLTVKIAGIALFAIEIIWFIGRPIVSEMREWGKRRGDLTWNGATLRSAGLLAAGALLAVVPLPWGIMLPAIAGSGHLVAVYPATSGQLVAVDRRDQAAVSTGDPLFRLQAPETAAAIQRAERAVALAEVKLRRVASDANNRSQRRVLEEGLARERSTLEALRAQASDLIVRAPASGLLVDSDPLLAAGQWVSPSRKLAAVRSGDAASVTAFAPAPMLRRLDGATAAATVARFVPEEPELGVLRVTLQRIVPPTPADPALAALIDVNGGALRSAAGPDGTPQPVEALYRLELVGDPGAGPMREIRGTLHLRGAPESLAFRLLARVAGVLVRESGF